MSPNRLGIQQMHFALHTHIEMRSQITDQWKARLERHMTLRAIDRLERQRIERWRDLPVIPIDWTALAMKDGILTAFRADPESFLASEDIHVRHPLARSDE